MRLAMAVAIPESVTSEVGICGLSLDDVLTSMVRCGYHGIELMPVCPDDLDVEGVGKRVRSYGLEIPVVGTGLLRAVRNLSLFSRDSETREAAWHQFQQVVRMAAQWGAMVNIGGFRGRLGELSEESGDPDKARDLAHNILRKCCDYAQGYGVILGLEPLNRYETDFVRTAQEGVELLSRLNAPGIGLVLDTFHMNIEEANLLTAVKTAGEYIVHVHLGDNNRKAPGWGQIDFGGIVSTLREIGYDGYLSGEFVARPDHLQAIRQTATLLRPLLMRA